MSNGKANGQIFINHPAVRPAWSRINVGNGTEALGHNPASFLITPDNEYSLVSAHVLAELGVVEYERFSPNSHRIGYFEDPSGREVLIIGGVRLEVKLKVAVNTQRDALFRGVIGFMVYQEPPEPADRAFSMGRCSLLCCHGWNRLLVPHDSGLPLHVPLSSQQQQLLQQHQQQIQQHVAQQLHLLYQQYLLQQQQLAQQNGNGHLAIVSTNANPNPHTNSDSNVDAQPTLTASASNNHGTTSGQTNIHPMPN